MLCLVINTRDLASCFLNSHVRRFAAAASSIFLMKAAANDVDAADLPNRSQSSLLLIEPATGGVSLPGEVMQITIKMIALFLPLVAILGFPALADRTNLTPAS